METNTTETSYLEIENILKQFDDKELMFKYDGERSKTMYTIIGRMKDVISRGETDAPIEKTTKILIDMEMGDSLVLPGFLLETTNYLITKYGPEAIIIITLRERKVICRVLNIKELVLDFEGDFSELLTQTNK